MSSTLGFLSPAALFAAMMIFFLAGVILADFLSVSLVTTAIWRCPVGGENGRSRAKEV
jgi:hypothetical protein